MTNLVVRQNNAGNRWLDPMFEDFFSVPSIFDRRADTFIPKANILESQDKLVFTFEVPGMNKDDIQVTITDRVLSVKGRREDRRESEKAHFVRREMLTGEFERQFTLPEAVRTDDIQAAYSNGILTIELEKKDEVKPRQVDVKIS
ncbi:MAG: Hsp20/alpha crystallin family protein [candidate division Zixibacteria bacterium]|nr:Hsp20/alpha crystallin family protein [candidate division Zixibacteria bacterium]